MTGRRLEGTQRGAEVRLFIDDEEVRAHEGETVATALFAAGRDALRQSARLGAPRGIFCNMGICFECLVYVEGSALRACMLPVRDGMRITTWKPEATP